MTRVAIPLKWRPRVFKDVVGQEVLVRTCSQLIKRGQRAKNLVIAGAYGSGKTTTARIYGKALNCKAPDAEGSPCLQCENCLMHNDDGTGFPDYMEFDGSSQGRIEQIKQQIEVARQPPMFGRVRIMVVDEAQGVSRQGFDALLKIVEEPPPWLAFIFLTTEADKIRQAIKSRCTELEVKLLDNATAVGHLRKICDAEGYVYEPDALDLIAYISKGHPRDLLKNLEQVADAGDVTLESAKEAFSLGYIKTLILYGEALLANDLGKQIALIRDWAESPNHKLHILRQFFLHIYYADVIGANLTINPVFDLIPRDNRRVFTQTIRTRADALGHTSEHLWQQVTTFWSEVPTCETDTLLEMFLVHFHHLINSNNFIHSKLPAVSLSERKGTQPIANRTERPFVQSSQNRSRLPPPTTLNTAVPTVATKVTPVATKVTPVAPPAPASTPPTVVHEDTEPAMAGSPVYSFAMPISEQQPQVAPTATEPTPPAEPEIDPFTPPAPTKVYPHTLQQFGFTNVTPLTDITLD